VVRVSFLLAFACGCIQPPPHATVVVNTPKPLSAAVLVMPTVCVSRSWAFLCDPSGWGQKSAIADHAATWGFYIDAPLRLKLEFAGFTLAEAGAIRLVTADRIDTNGTSEVLEAPAGARTAADLSFDDARAVARSLGIRNILVPTLVITPAKYATHDGELSIALVDIDTGNELWNVRCKENILSVDETPNRLANCVGNGVLAVLAPENVIGKAR
jgi:hypothetical protein